MEIIGCFLMLAMKKATFERNLPGWKCTRMPTAGQGPHSLVPGSKRIAIHPMAEDDRRRGEIITASPLGNENQKQLEQNAALEQDGYVHHFL